MRCGNKRPSRVRNLKDLPFPLGCADQLTAKGAAPTQPWKPTTVDPSAGAVCLEDDLQLIAIHNGTKNSNNFWALHVSTCKCCNLINMRDKSSPEFGRELVTPGMPGSGAARRCEPAAARGRKHSAASYRRFVRTIWSYRPPIAVSLF